MTSPRNVAVFKYRRPGLLRSSSTRCQESEVHFSPGPSLQDLLLLRRDASQNYSIQSFPLKNSSAQLLGNTLFKHNVCSNLCASQRMVGMNHGSFVQLTTKHVQPIQLLSAVIIGAHTVSRHILTCKEIH